MSRMRDDTLHRGAEAVGSKASAVVPFSDRLPGERVPPHSPLVCAVNRWAMPASTSITSSSKPFCPLSRYRPELRICSATERIRPVDGQRLPSAYPAACAADLRKDWLPPPFTDLPAMVEQFKLSACAGRREFSIPRLGPAFRRIHPFRGFTGNRRVSHPVKGR